MKEELINLFIGTKQTTDKKQYKRLFQKELSCSPNETTVSFTGMGLGCKETDKCIVLYTRIFGEKLTAKLRKISGHHTGIAYENGILISVEADSYRLGSYNTFKITISYIRPKAEPKAKKQRRTKNIFTMEELTRL